MTGCVLPKSALPARSSAPEVVMLATLRWASRAGAPSARPGMWTDAVEGAREGVKVGVAYGSMCGRGTPKRVCIVSCV